jgi:hypothetical protein
MIFLFRRTTLLITSLAAFASCGDKVPAQQPSSSFQTRDVSTHAHPVPPAEVVRRFYRWYLTAVYLKEPSAEAEGPQAMPGKNGRYYLDTTKHRAFLRRAGYFSPRFYANEQLLFDKCNHQLRRVSAKQVEESGGFAGDFVNGSACDFLRWMVWTGGQGEFLNTVTIKKTTLLADSAVVVAALSDSASGAADEYSYPQVTLVQEKGEWKISRITISFPATPSGQ